MQKFSSVIFLLFLLSVTTSASANNSKSKILILGDSLSAAYKMPVERGWVQLFANYIRAKSPQTSTINASISGETSFGGLQRLPKLLSSYKPTHLVIELAGNDGLRGLDFKQTAKNLGHMIDMAQTKGIHVLLIGVRMPANFGAAYNQRFQNIFNALKQQYQVQYLPRFLQDVAASNPDLMQADGIHPTQLAQPILAKKVLRAFTQMPLLN